MTHNAQHLADVQRLLQDHQRHVFDKALRSHFAMFIGKCFATLNPGTEYLHNWHIDAIAWHLEQVRLGSIKRLIINMPPRSAKSISASVAFPAFVHGWDSSKKIITISYGQSLSTKLHNDYRLILSSEWYRRLFPSVRIDPKKCNEQEVRLTNRGNRFSTSVGGVLTGRGGDIIIVDDPLKPDEAMSEPRRSSVNDWYSNTVLSRLNQKKEGAIVIVTQRLHADDLVGHLTEFDGHGFTVLNLPAIAVEDQSIPVWQGRCYERTDGELLHPAREDMAVLDELKRNIGTASFEAQYQQRPLPPDGVMFNRGWLNYYDDLPENDDESTVYQSWDTAAKTGKENDWSVGTTWMFKNHFYYLIDVCREKLNYPDLKARMIQKSNEYAPSVILIEDAGLGSGLITELRNEGLNAVEVKATKSKEVRANQQTPKFESCHVLFPRSAPWLSELEAELLAFPGGRHDDQVDSITQALAYEYLTVGGGVDWI